MPLRWIAWSNALKSTAVARHVYELACKHGKRVQSAGGAKNTLLVMPDALESGMAAEAAQEDPTIRAIMNSAFGCAGQRCMAASLMVAVGDVDPLIEKIVEHTRGVRLGVDMGAIIEKRAHERLVADVAQGEREGAKLALDGRDTTAPEGFEGGYWLAPSILDQVTFDMECANRELFGPVLSIVHVKDIDEALALQSRSPYGNAYSVFTTRGATARYVAENSEAAMIGVNIGVPVPREPFSFGGSKQSKFGSHDMTGWGGVDFWTWTKKITTKWSLQPDATWMS